MTTLALSCSNSSVKHYMRLLVTAVSLVEGGLLQQGMELSWARKGLSLASISESDTLCADWHLACLSRPKGIAYQ